MSTLTTVLKWHYGSWKWVQETNSLQELKQMTDMQPKPAMQRRCSVFARDSSSSAGQIKSELSLQQRKFDRLEQKEKRIQVEILL